MRQRARKHAWGRGGQDEQSMQKTALVGIALFNGHTEPGSRSYREGNFLSGFCGACQILRTSEAYRGQPFLELDVELVAL